MPAPVAAREPATAITADEAADAGAFDAFISAKKALVAPTISSGEWINSQPLDLPALKGKVVLVDFWTFGCENCRHTFPSLKHYDSAYREKGLTIVGVHTPESSYEKKPDNVKAAIKAAGIEYSVVTDVGYDTWNAYGVNAWPTVMILDKAGRIRYRHVGEGAYDTQEAVIKTVARRKLTAATGEQNKKAATSCGCPFLFLETIATS